MKKYLLLSIAIFTLAQIACSKDSSTGRVVQCQNGEFRDVGIVGGKSLNSQTWLAKGEVMLATALGGDNWELCTGMVITKNVILTAAHCVHERTQSDDKATQIYFSADPKCDMSESKTEDYFRNSDKILEHPNFNAYEINHDLALIHFQGSLPSGFHPLPLMKTQVSMDDSAFVFVSGFGKETDYNDKAQRHVHLKVAKVKVYSPVTQDNSREKMIFDQRNGEGICAGDSGGPALIKGENGQLTVVGVASTVEAIDHSFGRQEDVTCTQGVAYTSVYFFRDWIESESQKLQALAP